MMMVVMPPLTQGEQGQPEIVAAVIIGLVSPVAPHMGEGVDGEGLKVPDGTIEFKRLGPIIRELSPDSSFIPEIWQGHKNKGDGFWTSLSRLEEFL